MARVHFHLSDSFDAMRDKYGATDPHIVELGEILSILDEEAEKVGGKVKSRRYYQNGNSSRPSSMILSKGIGAPSRKKVSPSILNRHSYPKEAENALHHARKSACCQLCWSFTHSIPQGG